MKRNNLIMVQSYYFYKGMRLQRIPSRGMMNVVKKVRLWWNDRQFYLITKRIDSLKELS